MCYNNDCGKEDCVFRDKEFILFIMKKYIYEL